MAFLRQCLQQLRLHDKEVDLLLTPNELGPERGDAGSGSLRQMQEPELVPAQQEIGVTPHRKVSEDDVAEAAGSSLP